MFPNPWYRFRTIWLSLENYLGEDSPFIDSKNKLLVSSLQYDKIKLLKGFLQEFFQMRLEKCLVLAKILVLTKFLQSLSKDII